MLMTRESGRDTRATLIIVLDTTVDRAAGDRGFDGHVIRAQQLLPSMPATDPPRRDRRHPCGERPHLRLAIAGRRHTRRTAPSPTGRRSVAIRRQSDAIRPRRRRRSGHPSTCGRDHCRGGPPYRGTGRSPSPLSPASRKDRWYRPSAPRLRSADPTRAAWHEAAERMIATSLPERRSSAPAGHRRDRSPVIDARDRTRGSRAQGNPPSPTMAMRLIRVGVLAVYAALTIMGAAGLADAGGWWPWTAGLMLAAVIVESSFSAAHPCAARCVWSAWPCCWLWPD